MYEKFTRLWSENQAFAALLHGCWQDKAAIEGILFHVKPGTVLICIGENGVGESTLILKNSGIQKYLHGFF